MNYPEQAAPPVAAAGPGALTRLAAQVTLGTAIGGLATGLLGASIGISTGNLDAGILIRGLLALVLVLLICRAAGARATALRVEQPLRVIIGGALLGFLLDPLTWQARTGVSQLLADPGPVTVIGDLLLWLVIAVVGTRLGLRSVAAPAPAATPYG